MTGEHVIEAVGRSRIRIKDGRIVEVEASLVKTCPLAKRFASPVDEMTIESVTRNIENRIRGFGMCTSEREILSEDTFVGFGATEMISTGITAGVLDAAVIAGDGIGSVVVSDPALVQGIGGRMSGLVSTSPIPEVIQKVREHGGIVVDPETAALDPVRGVRAAKEAGYKRLAVTVAGIEAAEEVRREDPEAVIVVVHTTGTTQEEATRLCTVADLITGCSSKNIREVCGPKAIMQAGSSIPVYAMTQRGKEIIIERIRKIPHQMFVTHKDLPVRGSDEPNPLI